MVKLGIRNAQPGGPLYPGERTSSGCLGRSEKCQQATSCPATKFRLPSTGMAARLLSKKRYLLHLHVMNRSAFLRLRASLGGTRNVARNLAKRSGASSAQEDQWLAPSGQFPSG
jgi:hypothetical protein